LSIAFPDRFCIGVPEPAVATLDEARADRPAPPVGSAVALAGTVCATTVEVDAPINMIASAAGPTVLEKQLRIVISAGS
jgi:hypothetical protein